MGHVYMIKNLRNRKIYIGSTSKSPLKRWSDHRSALKQDRHPNRHLQRTVNKYGLSCLLFGVLETTENHVEREQYYMDLMSPQYNLHPKATGANGYKRSTEQRQLISKLKTGNKNNLGRVNSIETREKISQSLKKYYSTAAHPMLGKIHNDVTRELMRANSPRTRNKPSKYTGIVQVHEGKVVGSFKTAKDAINSVLACPSRTAHSKIIRSCKTKIVAYGYHWAFENDQVKLRELLEPWDGNQQPSVTVM